MMVLLECETMETVLLLVLNDLSLLLFLPLHSLSLPLSQSVCFLLFRDSSYDASPVSSHVFLLCSS